MSNYQKYYQPLGTGVMVNPHTEEETTKSGIILTNSTKSELHKGVVAAVGAGTPEEPMVLRNRDVVIYPRTAGVEIEFNEVKFRILKQSDILATI